MTYYYKLFVGYSFDYVVHNLNAKAPVSHELVLKYDLPTPADLENNLTILTTFVLSYTSTHSRRTGPASSTPC